MCEPVSAKSKSEEPFAWRCSGCGRKLAQSQIGKEHAAAVLIKNGRRLASCPFCQGLAFNLEDERRNREVEAREQALKKRRKKEGLVYLSIAGLFFLALPACASFLLLVTATVAVGPLSWLDPYGKITALVLAGSCTFPLSVMGAGLIVPTSWLSGYLLFACGYAGVVLFSLLVTYVANKIGEGAAGVIFRS